MHRHRLVGLAWALGLLIPAGCNQKAQPELVVDMPSTDVAPPASNKADPFDVPLPPLAPPQKYAAALANAFRSLAEKKDEPALQALLQAQAVFDNDLVRGEIARLTARRLRQAAAARTAESIQAILSAGRAADAARLAADALREFGDGDAAERLARLKRQADALRAAQAPDEAARQEFLVEAEAALRENNLRAALLSFDQAAASGVDVTGCQETYDRVRGQLSRYDEQRRRAAELCRAARLEEAGDALSEARLAWDTPRIVEEIEACRLALCTRRHRLAVADFAVVGEVGMPLAGFTIAEEIVPHFKDRYDLIERSRIGAIMQDLKLEAGDLHGDEAARSEFGRLVKARFLVVGTISRLNGVAVHARLVDVQSGLVVQTANIVAATPRELVAKLPTLAHILQMTDEQKIAHEQEMAKSAALTFAEPAALPPPPAPPVPGAVVEPVIPRSPRPPAYGPVVLEDFQRIPAPRPRPPVVVIGENAPGRNRAFFTAIELGDNLFRRGLFVDALRHYQFALVLAPDRPEALPRIDLCTPFMPPPASGAAPRPRLAVLPFVEFASPGVAPTGLGVWAANRFAPYFDPVYDVVDAEEVFWWMNRLALTYRDVLIDPSARLLLARALGVRYFLLGYWRENAGFDANALLVDAEFDALAGAGGIHVNEPLELKLRLPELARTTQLPPARQAAVIEQNVAAARRVREAQLHIGKRDFQPAIGIYREMLAVQPRNCQVRFLLIEAERRQSLFDLEQVRGKALRQQTAGVAERRQAALAAEAQRQASVPAPIDAPMLGEQRQQAHEQLLAQARDAAGKDQYTRAIGLYESALALNRSPSVTTELAQTRARAAGADRLRATQEQAAHDDALALRHESELKAAQGALAAARQQRFNEEQRHRQDDAARDQAAHDWLLEQARQARARREFDVAISALHSARTLKPSPAIDRLVCDTLVDRKRAHAEQMGPEELRNFEARLRLEQARRRQAEQQAVLNQAKYQEAFKQARAAMSDRKFDLARQQYQLALLAQRTDAAVNGLRQADDAWVKARGVAEIARIAQEQQRKQRELENQANNRLLASEAIERARAALAADRFDLAEKALADARRLNATDPAIAQLQKRIADGRAALPAGRTKKQ